MSAIALSMADAETTDQNKYPARLEFDTVSMTNLAVDIRKCRSEEKDSDVEMYGRFEGYPFTQIGQRGYGFGNNDAFPAQLVVTKGVRFFGGVAPQSTVFEF